MEPGPAASTRAARRRNSLTDLTNKRRARSRRGCDEEGGEDEEDEEVRPRRAIIDTLPGDALHYIAMTLMAPALVALASTAKSLHAALSAKLELERTALRKSVLDKLRLDDVDAQMAELGELYGQSRSLTEAEGVMLAFLLERSGALGTQLTLLWLFSNDLGDGTAVALARALVAPPRLQLRSLWLSNNNIGDVGAVALAESLASAGKQLVELCLGENQITAAGCDAVRALLQYDEREQPVAVPALHVLVLEKNEIPPDAARELRRAVQHLRQVQPGRSFTLEL